MMCGWSVMVRRWRSRAWIASGNLDWSRCGRQQDRAKDDVKAELIIDRIASTEKIDVPTKRSKRMQHVAAIVANRGGNRVVLQAGALIDES